MTVIKLKYTIQHFEDGTVCFNATKNNDGEVIDSGTTYTIDISNNCDQILEPINFGISLQNVTSLLIPHCGLRYLPNEFQFCNLIVLDISHNNFRQVPDFVIYHNANLQQLNVSNNQITDFNLEPKCYKTLKYLNLGFNQLYDFPQWIFNSCTVLETLDLSNNPLEKILPLLSGRSLIKLCSLNLNNSNMKKNLKFIQEIPFLKKLYVSNITSDYLNTIQELPFKSYASVSVLVELQFSRLGYAYLNEDICELHALEILNLSYNHLSWLPNNFTNLKSLQILNVSNNELLCLPSNIDEFNNLTELYLSHNLIGSLPDSFTNLNKLKILDCYSNDLIEDALIKVNKLSSLVAFDIEQNSFSTNNDDQHYLEMRNNIWKDNKDRMSGCKLVDVSDDEEDKSNGSSAANDTDLESEVKNEDYTNTYTEENWDWDSDSIGDDSLLELPPYKFKLIRKPVPYNPSDHIHPMYFEDALEDDT